MADHCYACPPHGAQMSPAPSNWIPIAHDSSDRDKKLHHFVQEPLYPKTFLDAVKNMKQTKKDEDFIKI